MIAFIATVIMWVLIGALLQRLFVSPQQKPASDDIDAALDGPDVDEPDDWESESGYPTTSVEEFTSPPEAAPAPPPTKAPVGPEEYFLMDGQRLAAKSALLNFDRVYRERREFPNHERMECIVIFDDDEFPFSLDLHGFTATTARSAIRIFLNHGRRHGLPRVRMIHGHGSVLGEMVQEELEEQGLEFHLGGFGPYDGSAGHVDVELPSGDGQLWPTL